MWRIYLFSILLLISSSCIRKNIAYKPAPPAVSAEPSSPPPPADRPSKKKNILVALWKADAEKINPELKKLLQPSDSLPLHDSVVINHQVIRTDNLLRDLYKTNQYELFWKNGNSIIALQNLLNSSVNDGLIPEDYKVSAIGELYNSVRKNPDPILGLKLELMCSRAFLYYATDMWQGKTDPANIFSEWNYKRRAFPENFPDMLAEAANGKLEKLPEKLRPPFEMYRRFMQTLIEIDSLKKIQKQWPQLTYPGKTLKHGDSSDVVRLVKEKFDDTGLYSFDEINGYYDSSMVKAVKMFQKKSGLRQTGILDKTIYRYLNLTLEDIRNSVCINMEQCRWILHDLPEKYILVNVVNYKLYYHRSDTVVFRTNVVVGKDYNKTPIFNARMKTIEFNPYWKVPASIAGDEILPFLQKDTTYLTRNNMQIFLGETCVSPATIDFSQYSKDYFPYIIKQLPGPKNSLGIVKFLLPNPHDVYLHDTPSKSLFNKDERTFSHGCIRVQYPVELAYVILKDEGYSRNSIEKILDAKENYPIQLKEPIPVYITYWTSFYDDLTKDIYFLRDVYGRDKQLGGLLNSIKKW